MTLGGNTTQLTESINEIRIITAFTFFTNHSESSSQKNFFLHNSQGTSDSATAADAAVGSFSLNCFIGIGTTTAV